MSDAETAEAVREDEAEQSTDTVASPPRRRRTLRPLLIFMGIVLISLLAFRLFGPKPVPAPKVVIYSQQQTEQAQQHIDALGAQLADPAPDPPPPDAVSPSPATPRASSRPSVPVVSLATPTPEPPKVVRLQLSQADLNTYLATDRRIKGLLTSHGIQAVQVILQAPHNVVFRATVLYKGRKTNVQIAGALLPSPDTFARLDATQAQVGTLPLPTKVVTAQADRITNQLLGHLRGRLPITVQTIQVIDDHLVVTGLRHPRPTAPDAADSRQSASPAHH